MFPTQYPTKAIEDVRVRLVRPATFEGIKVHPRNTGMTQGTVMK